MLESKVCKRYTVVPAESTLSFEARSTMHNVHGAADNLSGFIEAARGEDGTLAADPAPHMRVEFPVERLRSGNDLQDREMWRLIDSRRFPTVIGELRELHASSSAGRYVAEGDVTLSGRMRRYNGEMAVSGDGERVVVDGELSIDIRDFGLKPPNLVIVKVDPVVRVQLHLVAAATP